MIKGKKRYCDRCKTEMPMIHPEGNNDHDIVGLGWKTKSGSIMDVKKDLCTDCMDMLDEFLQG